MRQCSTCKTPKDDTEFFKRKERRNGFQSVCKICMEERRKIRRLNPEVRKREYERSKLKKRLNPEKWSKWLRKNRLRRLFNMSETDYDNLLTKQNGVCAICKREEKRFVKGKQQLLSVDHCHKTGRVRGLLCSNCNPGIGLLNEDPIILHAAISYLEQNKALAV